MSIRYAFLTDGEHRSEFTYYDRKGAMVYVHAADMKREIDARDAELRDLRAELSERNRELTALRADRGQA